MHDHEFPLERPSGGLSLIVSRQFGTRYDSELLLDHQVLSALAALSLGTPFVATADPAATTRITVPAAAVTTDPSVVTPCYAGPPLSDFSSTVVHKQAVLGSIPALVFWLLIEVSIVYAAYYAVHTVMSMPTGPSRDTLGDSAISLVDDDDALNKLEEGKANTEDELLLLPAELHGNEYTTVLISINKQTRQALQDLCRGLKMPTSGNKAALISRLRSFSARSNEWKQLLMPGAHRSHRGPQTTGGNKKAVAKASMQRRDLMFGSDPLFGAGSVQPQLPTNRRDTRSLEQKAKLLEWARRNVERHARKVVPLQYPSLPIVVAASASRLPSSNPIVVVDLPSARSTGVCFSSSIRQLQPPTPVIPPPTALPPLSMPSSTHPAAMRTSPNVYLGRRSYTSNSRARSWEDVHSGYSVTSTSLVSSVQFTFITRRLILRHDDA